MKIVVDPVSKAKSFFKTEKEAYDYLHKTFHIDIWFRIEIRDSSFIEKMMFKIKNIRLWN